MKTLIPLLILYLFLVSCSQENEVLDVEEEKMNEIIQEENVEEIIIEQEKTREEESSKQIIYNYYNYIQTGELQKAFDLRTGSSVDLETFKSWYKDLIKVNLDNIEEIENDTYSFEVDMSFDNGNISKYKVVSKVVDGMIENISSEEIINLGGGYKKTV